MEMKQMTKIVLAYELLEQGISKASIAERLKVSRRTVIRWAQAIEQYGSLDAYLDHYQQARTKRATLSSNPLAVTA
jgi:transposase